MSPAISTTSARSPICANDHNRDDVARSFAQIGERADVVLIAGDMTTHGEPEQAEMFVACRRETDLPVVAVLGNHDWHANRHDEFVAALREGDVTVLEGASWTAQIDGVSLGVAGAKGFVGGFDGSFQPDFGEPSLRALYRETGSEVDKLDRALQEIEGCGVRIALMHYAPVRDTLAGEPEGIFTFLGSGRLSEPLLHHRPDLALHGHAHAGTLEGSVAGLVPVYNVAVPVMSATSGSSSCAGRGPRCPRTSRCSPPGSDSVAPVTWANWAGDQRCEPAAIETPRDEAAVAEIVRRAREAGQTVRVAGAGHSFSDLVPTDGVLLRLDSLSRVLDADRSSGLVRVQAGITLHALGPRLAEHGLGLENQGDIDAQTLAGALSTATHGTGARFCNLSANVVGMRLVDGQGEVVELSDPEDLRAARVSLGALGVITEVTVRCVPLYGLDRVDEPRPIPEVLGELDALVEAHDHFELFAFPHTQTTMVRRTERVGAGVTPTPAWRAAFQEEVLENAILGTFSRIGRRRPGATPALNRLLMRLASRTERRDLAYRVYASHRGVHFTEMEYALPREVGREALQRVLDVVAQRGSPPTFPFEMRFVAPDDALLSPPTSARRATSRSTSTAACPARSYFSAAEAIFDEYGGRPHWGKRHIQTAATLAPRYPEWATSAARVTASTPTASSPTRACGGSSGADAVGLDVQEGDRDLGVTVGRLHAASAPTRPRGKRAPRRGTSARRRRRGRPRRGGPR